MKKISFQYPLLFFLSIYFLIAFYPLQFYLSPESYIPLGQIIFLLLVAIFSPIAKIFSFKKVNYFDFKIILYLLFYVVLNSSFQSVFDDPSLMRERILSTLGTLVPLLAFFMILSIHYTDRYMNTIFRYFFYGCFIYSAYYFEYFVSRLISNLQINDSTSRIAGQRDSIYLNFSILFAMFRFQILKNNIFDNFQRIIIIITILFALTVMILSSTRMGYLLLFLDLTLLFFMNRKYFMLFIISMLLATIAFYLIDPIIFNEKFDYNLKRLNTMVNFFTGVAADTMGLDIRLNIWGIIVEEMKSSPVQLLFGTGEMGVHSLGESYIGYNRTTGYAVNPIQTAESQYFDTLFRRGLIGITFLFIILFRVIYLSFRLIKIDSEFAYIYKSFFIGFLGVALTFIFLPLLRDRNFALFFFTVYALLSSRIYGILSKKCI